MSLYQHATSLLVDCQMVYCKLEGLEFWKIVAHITVRPATFHSFLLANSWLGIALFAVSLTALLDAIAVVLSIFRFAMLDCELTVRRNFSRFMRIQSYPFNHNEVLHRNRCMHPLFVSSLQSFALGSTHIQQ